MFNSFGTYISDVFKCLLIVFFISSCEDKNITLVNDGDSNCEIVLLDSATKHNIKSAKILQNYIQKISDVSLNIVDESSQNENKNKIYVVCPFKIYKIQK